MRNFNPRPPWGGRPFDRLAHNLEYFISIHALRGEGDRYPCRCRYILTISIHALRGEGDQRARRCKTLHGVDFNPRPPWGGRRIWAKRSWSFIGISIHALRGEGDELAKFTNADIQHFNPRPPWGGRRRAGGSETAKGAYFNPRPPWGGRLL